MNELERFLKVWEHEAQNTVKLLRALPTDRYDFRPDPQGRSLGELAWHLAEGDAYMTYAVENGREALKNSLLDMNGFTARQQPAYAS
jgi:uncharacterized damage-inducible protein DinB